MEIKYSEWDGSLDYIIDNQKREFNINLSRDVIIKNALGRGLIYDETIYKTD